jgi:hypothetical protein
MKRILFATLVLSIACCSLLQNLTQARPSTWAQPVHIEGMQNLFRVSCFPTNWTVYRSAFPSREGIKNLNIDLGVSTFIDLSQRGIDGSWLPSNSIVYHIPMNAWQPKGDKVMAALTAISKSKYPIVIFCDHGSDRTGMIIALYRLVFQNWSSNEAIREMTLGGFGFHSEWLIIGDLDGYIRRFDAQKAKQSLGL